MRATTLVPFLMCVAAGVTACDAVQSRAPTSEVTDSAGVRIVYSGAPAWSAADAWRLEPTPLVSIGVVEGAEAYMLARVTGAGRLSDGSVALMNAATSQVRLFGPEGTHRWTAGGPGQGPGEFQGPGQLMVGAGDTILVWEQNSYRVTRFAPDGTVAGVESPGRPSLGMAFPFIPESMRLLPDGGLLARLWNPPTGPPVTAFRPARMAVRVSAERDAADTLLTHYSAEAQVVRPIPGSQLQFDLLGPHEEMLTPFVSFGRSPAAVCVGHGQPDILCVDAEGARSRIRWAAQPVALTDGDLQAWRDNLMALLTRGLSEADAERHLSRLAIPATRPAYARLLLDVQGNLWAQRPGTWLATDEPVTFSVFGPDGRWLGDVAAPALQALEIGEDYLVGLHRDPLGVESVRVHRLVRGR